ncbi:hypothetical protein [Kitasatospora sp. NPDC098663]|uniref:hypothetical protein n=1 Tax=Kitasatospora sp. NPDC098663 TaxID=3364096 RepID=UPI003815B05C
MPEFKYALPPLANLVPAHCMNDEPVGASADGLDPDATGGGPYLVRWEIDSDEEAGPAQAALDAWRTKFRRGYEQPSAEDACVFTVIDRFTGRSVQIDLSDERHTTLFH